jgi:anti-sigma-K factor RskA
MTRPASRHFANRPEFAVWTWILAAEAAAAAAAIAMRPLLTAARESASPCDLTLVATLGLLGLRIFEATAADIADLGEGHGRDARHWLICR